MPRRAQIRTLDQLPLFVTDKDLGEAIMPIGRAAEWAGIAHVLERHGLPRIDPQFGGRYWPAVKRFLDRRAGLTTDRVPGAVDGPENFERNQLRRRRGTVPPGGERAT